MLSESSRSKKHSTIQIAGRNFLEESSTERAYLAKAGVKQRKDEVKSAREVQEASRDELAVVRGATINCGRLVNNFDVT